MLGVYCYIVEDYKSGVAVVIKIDGTNIGVVAGDWDGNRLPPEGVVADVMSHQVPKLVSVMMLVKLKQAEFFFDSNNKLVDVQLSLNKFIGPGMLRDLFGKNMSTQKVLRQDSLTQQKIETFPKGKYIAKASRSRTYMSGDKMLPLYARI